MKQTFGCSTISLVGIAVLAFMASGVFAPAAARLPARGLTQQQQGAIRQYNARRHTKLPARSPSRRIGSNSGAIKTPYGYRAGGTKQTPYGVSSGRAIPNGVVSSGAIKTPYGFRAGGTTPTPYGVSRGRAIPNGVVANGAIKTPFGFRAGGSTLTPYGISGGKAIPNGVVGSNCRKTAFGFACSDLHLKRDVVALERLDNGISLYRFRYLWDDRVYVGVMAQEVATVMPAAVIRGSDGYLRVNYGRLGLRLQSWDEWKAAHCGRAFTPSPHCNA
jgi:hypothetical protein